MLLSASYFILDKNLSALKIMPRNKEATSLLQQMQKQLL